MALPGMAFVFLRIKRMKMSRTGLWTACFLGMALAASLVHAQGRMIAVDSSRALFEVDIVTGVKTPIGTVSANAGTTAGLAYDPSAGVVYLASSSTDSLYTLDINTGSATLIGAFSDSGIVMHGLEFDSSTNTLFGASGGGTTAGNLYTLNPVTGLETLVGNSGLTSFTNLVHDSLNNVMYATNSGTDSFYTINRATGAATLIGPLAISSNPNGLAYNSDNDTIYLVDNTTDNFYSINRATGTAQLIGAMGTGNLLGLVYIPAAIPEPGTLMLTSVLLGLGLTTARRRRPQ
jgi:DNA-binding beta-propeller fold protein YncE